MMTHVFSDNHGNKTIAAKGAPEALLDVSSLTEIEKQHILDAINLLTTDGYRVLGVGVSKFFGDQYPARQQDLPFEFIGIVAFYDPPKKNIQKNRRDWL